MTVDVEGYEILWDDKYVYLTFVNEDGNGEALTFSHEEYEKLVGALVLVSVEISS